MLPSSPDKEEVRAWIERHSNRGRWGTDDEAGAINLVTTQKRLEAIATVRTGESISLARTLSTTRPSLDPVPFSSEMSVFDHRGGSGGGAGERLQMRVHGYEGTHIDALGHAWGDRGMWNGTPADACFGDAGLIGNAITSWRDGIVTRAILVDLARHRGADYLDADTPVGGDELEAAIVATGVEPRAGDAIVIRSGRDAFERANPSWNPYRDRHPGLGVTVLPVLRRHDFSMILWDFMDFKPYEIGWPFVPHAALFDLGVALVDNCSLDPLANRCAPDRRAEMMIMVAPLVIEGGTGSPVNPIAML